MILKVIPVKVIPTNFDVKYRYLDHLSHLITKRFVEGLVNFKAT